MNKQVFITELTVRDYECDSQGIVNNACYLHYFEHARHMLLQEQGIYFSELTTQKIYPVVTRIEISYHQPLSGGELIRIESRTQQKDTFRLYFIQSITKKNTGEIAAKALTCAAIVTGVRKRPVKLRDTIFSTLITQETDAAKIQR